METRQRLRLKLNARRREAAARQAATRNRNAELQASISQVTNNILKNIWGPIANQGLNAAVDTNLSNIRPLENMKPVFIVKWGPPASGKGSLLMKKVIKKLGRPLWNFRQFGVDDAVEASSFFKAESARGAAEFFKEVGDARVQKNMAARREAKSLGGRYRGKTPGPITSRNNMINALGTVSEKQAAKLGKPYANVRFARNANGRKMGNKLDGLMKQAIHEGRDVTFETTGSSRAMNNLPAWPAWIWSGNADYKRDFFSRYNLIIIFPMVPFQTAWKRYRTRAVNMYLRGNGFRFSSTYARLWYEYESSYNNFIANIGNPDKMALVNRVIAIPHKGRAIQWKPGATLNANRNGQAASTTARATLQNSRRRQALVELTREYISKKNATNFAPKTTL